MSMPHECKCGTCGRVMSPMFIGGIDYSDPKFTAAAAPDLYQTKWWATCPLCSQWHETGAACPPVPTSGQEKP